MAKISPDKIGNIPYFIAKLEKASATAEVIQENITGPGGTVTIPAGTTLAEAFQTILAKIDPAG